MARINLLPWREARRRQRQREFVGLMLGAVLLGALGVAAVHWQIEAHIAAQHARNQYLRDEIEHLKAIAAEIKQLEQAKAKLLIRFDVIQGLQASRPLMVKAFDELARLAPEPLYLAGIKAGGNEFMLSGTAQSNHVVSDFMRRLAASPSFGDPALRLIERRNVNGVPVSWFELGVTRPPGPENR